jgi:hypothetical protein
MEDYGHPRERLRQWIEAVHGGSKAEAARDLGCDPSYLAHLLREDSRRRPGIEFAVSLERATQAWDRGPILPKHWVDEEIASAPTSAPDDASDG